MTANRDSSINTFRLWRSLSGTFHFAGVRGVPASCLPFPSGCCVRADTRSADLLATRDIGRTKTNELLRCFTQSGLVTSVGSLGRAPLSLFMLFFGEIERRSHVLSLVLTPDLDRARSSLSSRCHRRAWTSMTWTSSYFVGLDRYGTQYMCTYVLLTYRYAPRPKQEL